MSSLNGKVALVTGGSRGIGLATARQLLTHGASVAITGTSDEHLKAAENELYGSGPLLPLRADVRQYGEVEAAMATVVSRFGGVDVLVNNAGVGVFRPVAEMSVDEWHRVIDTNLTGVFYCCHAALPRLRARGGGWIINIASLAGKNAMADGAAYCASKFGLIGFSESLMLDVRYDNIRVNYLMPGSVATEFNGRSPSPEDSWRIQPEDIGEIVLDLLAMPARTLPSRVEIRPTQPPRK